MGVQSVNTSIYYLTYGKVVGFGLGLVRIQWALERAAEETYSLYYARGGWVEDIFLKLLIAVQYQSSRYKYCAGFRSPSSRRCIVYTSRAQRDEIGISARGERNILNKSIWYSSWLEIPTSPKVTGAKNTRQTVCTPQFDFTWSLCSTVEIVNALNESVSFPLILISFVTPIPWRLTCRWSLIILHSYWRGTP